MTDMKHNVPDYELDDNVMSKVICCINSPQTYVVMKQRQREKKLLIIIIRRQRTTKDRSEANYEM